MTRRLGAKEMVILDITDVQPFDVLLTAGDAKLSGLIRSGQRMLRGESAPYSHAAMFLSPYLVVESLDTLGVVLTDLFEGSVNPHGNGARSSGEPFFFKANTPSLRMYARLEGVSAAEIRRFKPLMGLPLYKVIQYKSNVVDAISKFYLAEYPSLLRLLRTAKLVPDGAMQILERVGARWQGKRVTGPFCSELVTLLLSAIDPVILSCGFNAASVTPSDIYHNEDFFEKIDSSFFQDDTAIPGNEVPEVMVTLKRNIRISTNFQSFRAKIVQLNDILSKSLSKTKTDIGFLFDGQTIDEYYHYIMKESRHLWLADVEEHISEAAYVSKWMSDTNVCAKTCPVNRPLPST
jgi:hypothetical protein